MKSLPHQYEVRLARRDRHGCARICTAGLPELRAAPSVTFDGPGDAWSP